VQEHKHIEVEEQALAMHVIYVEVIVWGKRRWDVARIGELKM